MSLISAGVFIVKKTIRYFFVIALVAVYLICPGSSPAQQNTAAGTPSSAAAERSAPAPVVFTEKDRQTAIERLGATQNDFLKEIADLTPAQLAFRESPDRWSVAQVVEHVIVAENGLYQLITEKILKNSPPAGKDHYRARDRAVWMAVTNRAEKFKAPKSVEPGGRFQTRGDLISGFEQARGKTIGFVKTTKADLRNHFADNPVMGVIDAYQWLIFLNAHSQRHLEQIRQIKADPDFPKR